MSNRRRSRPFTLRDHTTITMADGSVLRRFGENQHHIILWIWEPLPPARQPFVFWQGWNTSTTRKWYSLPPGEAVPDTVWLTLELIGE